jgi:hypothetical protein
MGGEERRVAEGRWPDAGKMSNGMALIPFRAHFESVQSGIVEEIHGGAGVINGPSGHGNTVGKICLHGQKVSPKALNSSRVICTQKPARVTNRMTWSCLLRQTQARKQWKFRKQRVGSAFWDAA